MDDNLKIGIGIELLLVQCSSAADLSKRNCLFAIKTSKYVIRLSFRAFHSKRSRSIKQTAVSGWIVKLTLLRLNTILLFCGV